MEHLLWNHQMNKCRWNLGKYDWEFLCRRVVAVILIQCDATVKVCL